MADRDVAMAENDAPRLRSQVHSSYGRHTKGRGANYANDDRMAGHFEPLDDNGADSSNAQKSIDGWVLFITGLHEEATNEDIADVFAEHGEVTHTWLNLDRQTGYVKGYCLVEYRTREEAEEAITHLDGSQFLDQTIRVGWAFVKPSRGRPAPRGRR